MAFARLHYHLIWTTAAREPCLTEELEADLFHAIAAQAAALHGTVHALGSVKDHIHVVVSLPPGVSIADGVKSFKRASARAINRRLGADGSLAWQTGYGAATLDERSLTDVMAYVQNQKEHHRQSKLFALFEQSGDEAGTS